MRCFKDIYEEIFKEYMPTFFNSLSAIKQKQTSKNIPHISKMQNEKIFSYRTKIKSSFHLAKVTFRRVRSIYPYHSNSMRAVTRQSTIKLKCDFFFKGNFNWIFFSYVLHKICFLLISRDAVSKYFSGMVPVAIELLLLQL